MLRVIILAILGLLVGTETWAADDKDKGCGIPQGTVNSVQNQLALVVKLQNGGVFSPNRMWSAVVDPPGRICSVLVVGGSAARGPARALPQGRTRQCLSNSR